MIVCNKLIYWILTYRAELSFLVEFEALNASSVIPGSFCLSIQNPCFPVFLMTVHQASLDVELEVPLQISVASQ